MGTVFRNGAGFVPHAIAAPVASAIPAQAAPPPLMAHPIMQHTGGMFSFPFAAMPYGGSPQDWQSWAGNVRAWAQNLAPQIQAWAQQHASNPGNPMVNSG